MKDGIAELQATVDALQMQGIDANIEYRVDWSSVANVYCLWYRFKSQVRWHCFPLRITVPASRADILYFMERE